ncbi:hypothetical protein [Arsenophonus endosymbiont of Aphis craccivora]|uniref:hypothetical protein n=1 Tax=Arsenophonus endosymbiont of Aphis craccivora TaxID=1231049 RepID=UPI001EE2EFB4|nr:hypothetical protein [Arsenophonus endosymbiont of Aphis craccivora]
MPWGPDVETNLAISSANHLKVRFIQQSPITPVIIPADNPWLAHIVSKVADSIS